MDAAMAPDITILASRFKSDNWPGLSTDEMIYMESGVEFYGNLLFHDGLMLHASAVAMDGGAYLFSGPCGTGKSTHTRLWKEVYGDAAQVFNDDKPALRRLEDRWYAYGTPWCGKDGINQNMKVPLKGICFLKQSKDNRIRLLPKDEALFHVIGQTMNRFIKADVLDRMLAHAERIVQEIPVFELENRPDSEAARLSYETMRKAAKRQEL